MARWTRFRKLFGLEPKGDVDAELAFHVEMRVRELIEQGETPERARQRALERFGDYERARSACVAINERRRTRMDIAEFFTELKQDLGYAARMMRRTPAFTAAALVTLALGIGANSAIFSVVHGVLLESLPFKDADRLYQLQMIYPDKTRYSSLSAPDFMSVRADQQVFEQVEAANSLPMTVTGVGEPRELNGIIATTGLFDMLGVRIIKGRGFAAEESQAGRGNMVILSDGFWRRNYGSDDSIIGRSLTIGDRQTTVIGVASSVSIYGDVGIDAYLPIAIEGAFDASTAQGRRDEFLMVLARAKATASQADIETDLRRIGSQLERDFPQTNRDLAIGVAPLRELIVGEVRRPLLILLGAVGFVLLVACANVANLLLARGTARQGELAVRAALGAGRARLIRQLLTESLMLGLIGGLAGLAVAYWSTHALIAARPADLPRLDEIGLDATVVWVTLGMSLLTGAIFGLAPAIQATNAQLARGLQESGRTGGSPRSHRLRAALVIAEMALAVVLLTGAGLMIRSFIALTTVNPGFQPGGAIAMRVTLQGGDYLNRQRVLARIDELIERLRALPTVTAVGGTSVLPLSGSGAMLDFAVDGTPPPPGVNQEIAVASVTPDYFRAIGAPLSRGRVFTELDHDKAMPVALLNEAAVRKWFPNQDPIGKTVLSGGPHQVIGVVGDVLQRSPGQPAIAQMFLPYSQRTGRSVRLVVRSTGDAMALATAAREQVRLADPNLPSPQVISLSDTVTRSIARPRFYMSLLTLFAAVALVLSATGIFGVMSYAVAQQSKDIGIRMALGARAMDVLTSVVGRALTLAGIGVIVGVAAALVLGGIIRSQLFGVTVFDPMTLISVVAVLMLSAGLASLFPARRASRIDPVQAFRS